MVDSVGGYFVQRCFGVYLVRWVSIHLTDDYPAGSDDKRYIFVK